MLRERSSIFFLFLFPMLMILILGVAFGGSYTPKVGLVAPSSPLSQRLAASLARAEGIAIEARQDEAALLSAVEHGELEAGVILPADLGTPVRYVVRAGLQLTYRAIRRGFRVEEVPITFVDRRAGQSKMSRKIFAEAIVMVWKLRLDALRGSI
jgi:hypothetical protein